MYKSKSFIFVIVLTFKYVVSALFLLLKTILKELSIVLPYDNFEYKNTDSNKPRRFKVYFVICAILAGPFWGCYFNATSQHIIVTLDILFFFYLLIPFLFKTYSKYLPSVN